MGIVIDGTQCSSLPVHDLLVCSHNEYPSNETSEGAPYCLFE